MEAYMWIVWLGVFVIALVVEGATASLVSVWFALASLVSLIISFIPGVSWWIELIIFVVISFVTLLALRPIIQKYMKRNIVDTNIDEIVGKKGVMIKKYDELNNGEVRIKGIVWTAINTNETETIEEGTKVEVLAVNGNKLIVKTLKGENK